MPNIPNVTLRHVGMYVTDMNKMVSFYQDILGFTVADRGPFQDGEIAFLTRDPDEHHEIVFMTGRAPETPTTVNQVSFRADSFSDVRATFDLLTEAKVDRIDPVDHGNALSVYFWDPEDNRIEVYLATPWYVAQPNRTVLDFSLSDDEIIAANEAKCRADPTFCQLEDWKAKFVGSAG